MRGDLSAIESNLWPPEEPYKFDGFFGGETKVYHDGKWVGLSLRSQGGKFTRTDPGGPGLDDFKNTSLLELTPYLAEVLRNLNTPIRSARLLRLPPGGVIGEHRDTYHGFEYGQLRLHAPITTNGGIENIIRGQRLKWLPGELWYGDFGSLHSVRNEGETDRVHLVIDVLITPSVIQLFPDDLAAAASKIDVLFHEEPAQIPVNDLRTLECEFALSSTLVRGIFDIDDGIVAQLDAKIVFDKDHLVFHVDGRNLFKLVPLAGNRLMFAGWTLERYLQYERAGDKISKLELVLRRGKEETRIAFPLAVAHKRAKEAHERI
jgi:hypothetical protein